jgi:hypothetical protein
MQPFWGNLEERDSINQPDNSSNAYSRDDFRHSRATRVTRETNVKGRERSPLHPPVEGEMIARGR